MTKTERMEELLRSIIWVCDNKYQAPYTEDDLADAFRELNCFAITAKAILKNNEED